MPNNCIKLTVGLWRDFDILSVVASNSIYLSSVRLSLGKLMQFVQNSVIDYEICGEILLKH